MFDENDATLYDAELGYFPEDSIDECANDDRDYIHSVITVDEE